MMLEDVLDPGDSGTANDLSTGSGGALDNALASDEEDSFGKIPAEAAPAPVAVNAPAPAKKGLDGFSFSFIDGDESEEDAAAPTGAAATPPKADSGGAGSADFGDSGAMRKSFSRSTPKIVFQEQCENRLPGAK